MTYVYDITLERSLKQLAQPLDGMTKTGVLVSAVLSTLPCRHIGHKIIMDRGFKFTSERVLGVVADLNQYACGTVMANRGLPPEIRKICKLIADQKKLENFIFSARGQRTPSNS